MGLFNIDLSSPWYVAVHHGHSAMKLLRSAQEIEDQYTRNRKQLVGVQFVGAGYDAYGKLYDGLGLPIDDGAWEMLCSAYNLSPDL